MPEHKTDIELAAVPEIAEALGVAVSRVHQYVRDGALVAVRGEDGTRRVPAAFVQDGAIVKGLTGVVTLLRDAGYEDHEIVDWLFRHGIMPLYTPLSGSWLNMAESVQRIVVGRALAGQHPRSPDELIQWLEDTVAGWNRAPAPFAWAGKRAERRERARQRRLGGSAATLAHRQLFLA